MKRFVVLAIVGTMAVLMLSHVSAAQVRHGNIVIPSSSIARPEDAGLRAHTTYQLYLPLKDVGHYSATPTGETPASLACVYQLVPDLVDGCPIKGTTENPTGGRGWVAIVDAFHYPNAASDLNVFSDTFGLPRPTFVQVNTGVGVPAEDCGWEVEEALDIEWAHAMAPNANILLVEGHDNGLRSLMKAVKKASEFIQHHGGKGEVTMSWQAGEFPEQVNHDDRFRTNGVVYFASSGDSGGQVGWPSTSPYVVSAGGTRVNRDGSGNFTGETGWSGSGGGPSTIEARPVFQDAIKDIVGKFRGTPDFSFDADPGSGVSVYTTSTACGNRQWIRVGGTSVSSPALAGLVNAAHKFKTSSNSENKLIYGNLGDDTIFTDITVGHAGQYSAGPGWDFVTGVGSDLGYHGK